MSNHSVFPAVFAPCSVDTPSGKAEMRLHIADIRLFLYFVYLAALHNNNQTVCDYSYLIFLKFVIQNFPLSTPAIQRNFARIKKKREKEMQLVKVGKNTIEKCKFEQKKKLKNEFQIKKTGFWNSTKLKFGSLKLFNEAKVSLTSNESYCDSLNRCDRLNTVFFSQFSLLIFVLEIHDAIRADQATQKHRINWNFFWFFLSSWLLKSNLLRRNASNWLKLIHFKLSSTIFKLESIEK